MPVEHFENLIEQYCQIGGGALGIGSQQSDFLSDSLLLDRLECLEKNREKLWIYSTTPLISAAKYSDEELQRILKLFSYLEISVAGYDSDSYKEMVGVEAFGVLYSQLKRVERIVREKNIEIEIELSFRTNNKEKFMASPFFKEISNLFTTRTFKDHFFSWFGSIKQEELPLGATLVKQFNNDMIVDCDKPSSTLAVMPNGNVVGCGCIDWLQQYVIGNTYINTITEIWTSKKAKEFRHSFSNRKELPSICYECALYSPCVFRDKRYITYHSSKGLWYKY